MKNILGEEINSSFGEQTEASFTDKIKESVEDKKNLLYPESDNHFAKNRSDASKYLTIGDYIRSVIAFIPVFLLSAMIITVFTAGVVNEFTLILTFIFALIIIYLRLKLIISVRKKRYRMIWEAQKDYEQEN